MRKFLLNRQRSKAPSSKTYSGWDTAKTFQVVYDEMDDNPRPEITHLKELLEKENKVVSLLAFNLGKKPKEAVPANTFYKADLNLIGAVKAQVWAQFNADADVLIDWTNTEGTPVDFLVLKSESGFKISVGRTLPEFDLAITGKDSMPGKVIEEILKYLKMINHA